VPLFVLLPDLSDGRTRFHGGLRNGHGDDHAVFLSGRGTSKAKYEASLTLSSSIKTVL
jgi:hypothetical protein